MAIALVSCNPNKKGVKEDVMEAEQVEVSGQRENMDWLLGQWKRLNEEEGKETFEHWEKISPTEYAGLGFTLQAGDTIWQENMVLARSGNRWDLRVKSPEEPEYTLFKGTGSAAREFVVENPDIDFPNRIKYWVEGEVLKAAVSNPEMEIPFAFRKMDN